MAVKTARHTRAHRDPREPAGGPDPCRPGSALPPQHLLCGESSGSGDAAAGPGRGRLARRLTAAGPDRPPTPASPPRGRLPLLRRRAAQLPGGVPQPEALGHVAQVQRADVEDVLQLLRVGGVGADEGLQGCGGTGAGRQPGRPTQPVTSPRKRAPGDLRVRKNLPR